MAASASAGLRASPLPTKSHMPSISLFCDSHSARASPPMQGEQSCSGVWGAQETGVATQRCRPELPPAGFLRLSMPDVFWA